MPKQNRLYVFFGLIASGKSTLAAAWAQRTGAIYFNSDRIRKELAGILPKNKAKDSFNQGIYTPEFSKKTYDELLKRAATNLAAKKPVVLDASYQEREERQKVRDLAKQCACEVIFILCRCPEPLMKERMAIRSADPNAVSDGRWEIYLRQREKFTLPDELGPSQLISIDTNKPVHELLEQLEKVL